MPLRILIADDSLPLRQALRNLLGSSSDQWEVCGEAADGNDAVSKTLELKPDVVLLDLTIPVLSGVDVIKVLRKQESPATVVLMSQQDPAVMERIAVSAGVPFYVTKSQLTTELPALLQKIARGPSK